jgi:hypothetical protein
MLKRTRLLVLLTVILAFGLPARGGITLETPSGLTPGETFRFAYFTDGTTTATSSSIGHYNSFANSQAGGATYGGAVVNWLAIGSTSSTSAINNVGQTTTPVYLADGTLVTTSTTSSGLWSGSLLNPIDEDLSGGLFTHQGTWTGTNTNGSASGNPLGDFFGVVTGNSSSTDGTWVNNGVWPSDNTSGIFHMFGISQPLTAVPEPSSLVLAGTAMLGASAIVWSRKRRDRRP